MPKRSLILIIGFFILALFVFILWAALSQQELTAYQPDNYGPFGLKAVDLLLNKSGFSTSDSKVLGNSYDRLLIYTSGPNSMAESRLQILKWVKSGGTVIELARLKPELDLDRNKKETFILRKPNTVCNLYHLDIKLKYHLGGEKVYTGSMSDLVLIARGKRPIVYLHKYGNGRVINWNDPDGITNIRLKKFPDNAVIFTRIVHEYAASRQIVFYEPGISNSNRNQMTMTNNNYWYGGTILGIGIILLLWKLSARFGRPRPLILAKGRSADEFIYSMAALFQQADSQAMVLDNLYRELVRAISKVTNQTVDNDLNAMLERLQLLMGKKYERLKIPAVIELYQKNKDRKMNKVVFLELANRLDVCRKELNQWNP